MTLSSPLFFAEIKATIGPSYLQITLHTDEKVDDKLALQNRHSEVILLFWPPSGSGGDSGTVRGIEQKRSIQQGLERALPHAWLRRERATDLFHQPTFLPNFFSRIGPEDPPAQ